MPTYDNERGMVTPAEHDTTDSPTIEERHVYQKDDPKLYEHLESLMFSGATEVELDGQSYNAARDKDEQDDNFFVLTPAA